MGSAAGIDDDDLAAFREAVVGAQPLPASQMPVEPPKPLPVPRMTQRDAHEALADSLHAIDVLDLQLEGGDEAAWLRPGLPRSLLRDLRRGRWVIQASLDLHGMTRDEARQAVAAFLAECRSRDQRCLRIVHGKGLRSPGRKPVLKTLVWGWLSQRREVLAFCQARAAQGGAGAIVTLLAAR